MQTDPVQFIFELTRMRETIEELVHEVTERLRRKGLKGRVVTLKVRYPDFDEEDGSSVSPIRAQQ